MFKVTENGDGSTTIFCNKTGKLICTIRGQRCNMGLGPRPVNVVEPSPKPRSYCYNLDLKPECLSDDDEKQESRKCDSPPLEDCLENYTDDCITQENFARVLNLIPPKKLETESIDQLKSTFPLRLLSRTRAFVVNDDFRDIKLPDDVPVTSSLGVKILKFNKQKNFYCDQTIEMKIKNYDSFCRFQLNSVCSNFPKLRCREKKEYPICISQKIMKYGHTHMYAFNKRQRMENLITFKTGLTARSRKLLLKCNKRLAVNVRRLSPEEISTWLQKRCRTVRPVAFHSTKEEPSLLGSDSDATVIEQSSPFYIDVESISSSSSSSSSISSGGSYVMYPSSNKGIVSFSGILKGTERNSSAPRRRNRQNPKLIRSSFPKYDCFVKMGNILNGIHKYFGDYYVKGTNIRVPFFSDFLNSLNRKKFGPFRIPEANGRAGSGPDHAYHLPFSQTVARKKIIQNSQCLNHKSSKTKNKVSNCVKNNKSALPVVPLNPVVRNPRSILKSSVNVDSSQIQVIPVIDLTEDPAPVLADKGGKSCQKSKYGKSPNWIFQCYGCGFKQMYKEEFIANSCATKHMKDFHCVSDPNSFIEVVRSESDVRLEAFPGYKRSLVGGCA